MKPIILALAAIALSAQTVAQDYGVTFYDPETEHPYMLVHPDGRMELLPPYQPEQAYRLLLDREQMCWDAFNSYKPKP
jgi:hypothetical protein